MGSSLQTYQRIARILLLICSVSVPACILFAAWFLYQRGQVESLVASLLSQEELQERLLMNQPLDQTLMPHMVSEIGYVLNPYIERSTFAAHEGDSYRVNSLGLRGEEIGPKRAGVKRILIVGDSVAFGWKLEDEDRLSSILNEYTKDQAASPDRLEFLTIALPGWNVRSQVSFLESHLLLLDPDLILWWSIPNDIEDTNGVVPPGIGASWASPQAEHETPFAGLSALHKASGSFMPAIAERREKNVELIASFASAHKIPIVLLGLPAFPELRSRYPDFNPPTLEMPVEYRTDPRRRLSELDSHPSAWGNRTLAVGVLYKLGQVGAIAPVHFAESDKTIVEWFDRADKAASARPPVETGAEDFGKVHSQLPTSYRNEAWRGHESVLYGVGRLGKLSRAGTIFLRDSGRAKQAVLNLSLPGNISRYPGKVQFSVRSASGETTETTVGLNTEGMTVRLNLPEGSGMGRVFEISWIFDFVLCDGPGSCSVGTLLSADLD